MAKQPPKNLMSSFIGLFGTEETKQSPDKKMVSSGSSRDLKGTPVQRKPSLPPTQTHTLNTSSSLLAFKEPAPKSQAPRKSFEGTRAPSFDGKSRNSDERLPMSIDNPRRDGISSKEGSRTSFDSMRSSSLDLGRGKDGNPLQDPPPAKKLTPWKGITNQIKFEGYLDENRKFSSRCRLNYPNGDEYEGDFLNHKMHGTAACKYAQEEILFKGSWRFNRCRTDVPSAVHYLKSGDVYFGTVKNAEFISNSFLIKILRHGKGEFHASNGEKYYGSWKNDQKCGFGLMDYPTSEKYYGTWEDDQRSGHGLLIYKDGTIYDGEWKKDERNGNGKIQFCNGDTLTGVWIRNEIKNAIYKKGEISDTSRCTRLLMREQIGKVNSTKMNFSLVKESDLTGDKWSGFFSTSKLGETLRNGGIKEIGITELLGSNEVNHLTSDFVNMFHWKYDNSGSDALIALPQAIDDFLGFFYQFYSFLSKILVDQTFSRSDLQSELKHMLITKVYKPIFALYKKIHREQNTMYKYKLLSLSQVTMRDLGINKKLQLDYTNAIIVLSELPSKHNPNDKYDILVKVSDEIMKMITSENVGGADDLFPVFLYVFITARIPHVYSEFLFLTDFLDEIVSKTQKYYRFNNLEMAIQYIKLLDYNIRDEHGVLVPILYFEEKLEKVVSEVLRESSKKGDSPKLMWMTNLLIDLGNCDSKTIFTVDTLKYTELSHQSEYVKLVLKGAGLTLNFDEVYTISFDTPYPSNFYFKMANVLETILQRV